MTLARDDVAIQPISPPPVAQNPARVYVASLAPGSRPAMRSSLKKIAALATDGVCDIDTMPWHALRFQHTAAIQSELSARDKPATVNKDMAALKGTLTAAWNLGLIPTEEYHRAVNWKAVRGETLLRGRALDSGEIRALFAACADGTPLGARDTALLALLYGSGLRRSEAVAVDIDDYSAKGEIRIRAGKGHKERLVFLASGAHEAVQSWLTVRGDMPGPMFVAFVKGGRATSRRLSDKSVLDIVVMRARRAGLKHCSPHDMRRTFVSDLLDAGADISTVKGMAGHASVTTTTRYDRRGDHGARKASKLLHIPIE